MANCANFDTAMGFIVMVMWLCFLVDHEIVVTRVPSKWRHNEPDAVSNHRRLHCLLKCWFRRRSKETSKPRVTGLWCGKFTGDRWIPRKHQWRGKCFDFMTLSCKTGYQAMSGVQIWSQQNGACKICKSISRKNNRFGERQINILTKNFRSK